MYDRQPFYENDHHRQSIVYDNGTTATTFTNTIRQTNAYEYNRPACKKKWETGIGKGRPSACSPFNASSAIAQDTLPTALLPPLY